ncbi:hypothetical protein BZA77DRAFT_295389 [Pyronema omphalodes]|nr:hypothetical protein BZA77DRAFT_295389 [Pyronema omphalodes]
MTERITNQSKPLFQMDIMDAIYNDCLCHVCKNADFEDWTWIDFITERPRHSYEILKTLRDDSLEMEGNEAFPPNLRCPPEDWNCLIQAFTEKRKIRLHGRTIPAFTSVYNRKFLILVHLSIIQQQLREQMTQETVDRYIPKRAKQIIRSVNDTPGATEREECKYDLSWYEFVEKVHALTIKARRMTEKAKQGSGKEGNKEVNEEDKEEDTKAGKEKYNGTAWMDYIFANPEIAISNFRQHNGGDPSRFPRLLCSNKDFEIFLKAFDKLGKNDHVDYDEEDGHTLSCQYQCLFAMHFMLCDHQKQHQSRYKNS